jgi:hypothetical protein
MHPSDPDGRWRRTEKTRGKAYVFSGLVWCGNCGGRMHAHHGYGPRSAFYRCGNANTKGTCRLWRITEPELVRNCTAHVLDALGDVSRPEWRELVAARLREAGRTDPGELRRLRAELSAISRKIDKGEDKVLTADTPEQAKPLLDKLNRGRKERDALAERVGALESAADVDAITDAVAAAAADFRAALLGADAEAKRRVFRAVVGRVTPHFETILEGGRRTGQLESFAVSMRPDAFLVRNPVWCRVRLISWRAA